MKQYSVRVNGVLIRRSFASATAARSWQRSQKLLQDEIRAGTKQHMQPTLLSVQAVEFLKSREAQASYQHQVTWMGKYVLSRPKFQDKYLHELDRADWRDVFGPKGELIQVHKLSPATHNNIRAMVRKMYEDARKEYEPPRAIRNPIADIPKMKVPKKRIPSIETHDDIATYIAAAYEEAFADWGIFAMISFNTGLRQSNVMALRWRDFDEKGRRLWIREKYTRRGFLPGAKGTDDEDLKLGVNDALFDALVKHRKQTKYSKADDFIVTKQGGRPLRDSDVHRIHKRTLTRAGLSYIKPHATRHTYAQQYLAQGGSMSDLKANMFHSSITVTEKYGRALDSELVKRAEVFQVGARAPGKVMRLKKQKK